MMVLIDESHGRSVHDLGDRLQHLFLVELFLGSKSPGNMNLSFVDTFDCDFVSLQVQLTGKLFFYELSDVAEYCMLLVHIDAELVEELSQVS